MKALVLNAHNDDGIIGIGGTLIQLLDKGWKVGYIQLTDGRHGIFRKSRDKNKMIRDMESKKEREFLGIDYFHSFDVKDGSIKRLGQKKEAEIVDELAKRIRQYNPDVVFLPEGNENHPDHRLIHRLGHDAIKKSRLAPLEIGFFVWISPLKNHKSKKMLLIPIDKWFNKKIKAIKLHTSQENLPLSKNRYSLLVEVMNSYFSLLCPKERSFNKAEIICIHGSSKFKTFSNSLGQFYEITEKFNKKTTFLLILWKEFIVNMKSFKRRSSIFN